MFGNDAFAYQSARKELKMQFIKNKEVKDPVELNSLLRGIEEVDEMLRFNVVQVSCFLSMSQSMIFYIL